MPPRPRNSRMSSCGKCGAMVSGGNGAAGEAAASVKTVSVFRLRAIKQFGHNPAGALAGRGAPHCGQRCEEVSLIPVTYRSAKNCYKTAGCDRKSEIRNPKSEGNPNAEKLKMKK